MISFLHCVNALPNNVRTKVPFRHPFWTIVLYKTSQHSDTPCARCTRNKSTPVILIYKSKSFAFVNSRTGFYCYNLKKTARLPAWERILPGTRWPLQEPGNYLKRTKNRKDSIVEQTKQTFQFSARLIYKTSDQQSNHTFKRLLQAKLESKTQGEKNVYFSWKATELHLFGVCVGDACSL